MSRLPTTEDVSPGVEFYSGSRRVYYFINKTGTFYSIRACRGGRPPLKDNKFTSYKEAEKALIAMLKQDDRPFNRSRYPGCPEQLPQKPTTPS